jgi:HPt (histidine-containing phosphotransfer) domain-containing protein
MTQPPGSPLAMADFFALEAGEYLERLDGLLAPEGAPAADEFVRLARALRGSALMASQTAIARAAAGIESLARGLREGRRGWDPGTRQVAIRAVDDLKSLVRRVSTWTDAESTKAEAIGRELEQLSGRPSAMVRTAESLGLDAGARAFVAREGAAIASSLDRAATALRAGASARDPLQHVLRTLQPLRGLAALNDLPPLPEVLEGIERAAADVARSAQPAPASAPDFFQSAAAAIAQAAREVAERGRPEPEGPAFRAFAGQVARFFDREPVIVPVSDLYYDDSGPHIVQRGAGAAQAVPLSRVELVSHGEHLRLAADAIERSPSATQRELRVHTLAGTFRALAVAGDGALPKSLGRFVDAAREAVALGYAVSEPAQFATALRRAGEILASASGADDNRLGAALSEVAETLVSLTTPVPPPPPAAPAPTPMPVFGGLPFAPGEPFSLPEPFMPPEPFAPPEPFTPPESVVPPEAEPPTAYAPIVPIEELAPPPPPEMDLEPASPRDLAELFGVSEEEPLPEPPAPVAAPRRKRPMPPLVLTERSEVPTETPDLVGSWLTYERMLAAGIGPASLDVLLGVAAEPAFPAFDTTRISPPSFAAPPARAEAAPTPVAPAAPVELPIVDVRTLQYRGRRALERAQELRAIARRTPPDQLPALFEEVCDLVVLALESSS